MKHFRLKRFAMACVSFAISTKALRRCVPSLFVRSYSATDLDRWHRRCDRLAQLQRRIRFPPLQTLTVGGQTYELPLAAAEPSQTPSQEELEYLVGFFDGDGCVTMNKQTAQVILQVEQNVDLADVLLHFRALLGGGVYNQLRATGSRKAVLRWSVAGTKMQEAAAALSSIPSMKRAQLQIASMGNVALHDRAFVEKKFQAFKQKHHVPRPLPNCSWPYFAGFFDAEGSIHVSPGRCLRLQLSQVNSCILGQLQHFLHQIQLPSWGLYHYSHSSVLLCCNGAESKESLKRLLANGLRVKRQQAELALNLSADNHLQIRDAISALNGWQARYQRLDKEGIARSTEIQRLQARLRCRVASGLEYASLQHQLGELRSAHALQNIIFRCNLLRKDMRRALREGGQVTPPSIAACRCCPRSGTRQSDEKSACSRA